MRSWLVPACATLSLVIHARPAAADDTAARVAAIKAMLHAQTDALIADDDAAFKATLSPDAIASVGNGRPQKDSLVLQMTIGMLQKIVVTRSQIGWAGSWGWVAAELKVTSKMYAEPEGAGDPHPRPETATFHWVALVVADGDAVKTAALKVMQTKADKDLSDFNYIQDLTPMASPPAAIALLTQPVSIGKQLSSDAATTVFGSAPRDAGYGGSAARKLVGKWKKLVLDVVDTDDSGGKESYRPVVFAVGDATVTWAMVRMKLSSKRMVLLEAFAIARKVGDGSELVALEYGPDN